MQIILDQNEKLQVVYRCLTTGLPYFPDYGIALDFKDAEYLKCRNELVAAELLKGTRNAICVEDVQIEMIRQGFSLKFNDEEGGGDNSADLNLTQIEKNWDKIPNEKVLDMALENGNWDAETADIVMQYILFGEVIFG